MTAALENSLLCKVLAAVHGVCFLSDTEITAETRFEEDLGLDSLDLTELLFHVEDVLNVEIRWDVIPGLRQVADLISYLGKQFVLDTDRLVSIGR